jgi:hypothetical protein
MNIKRSVILRWFQNCPQKMLASKLFSFLWSKLFVGVFCHYSIIRGHLWNQRKITNFFMLISTYFRPKKLHPLFYCVYILNFFSPFPQWIALIIKKTGIILSKRLFYISILLQRKWKSSKDLKFDFLSLLQWVSRFWRIWRKIKHFWIAGGVPRQIKKRKETTPALRKKIYVHFFII